jgi:hypothetical protein
VRQARGWSSLNALYIAQGDGRGGFGPPQAVVVAGKIAILAAGALQPGKPGADKIVGLKTGSGSIFGHIPGWARWVRWTA